MPKRADNIRNEKLNIKNAYKRLKIFNLPLIHSDPVVSQNISAEITKPKIPDPDLLNSRVVKKTQERETQSKKFKFLTFDFPFSIFHFEFKANAQVSGMSVVTHAANQFGWPRVAKTRFWTS